MDDGLGGGALGGGAGAVTATEGAQYNYLSYKQQDMEKQEKAACGLNIVCLAQSNAKWAAISGEQNIGYAVGVGGGLDLGAYDMGGGIVKALGSPSETLASIKAIVNDPAFRASVGDAVADDYAKRVDRMATAYEDAGWDGSVTAGVEVGRLIFDVAGAVEVAGGVAKLGVSAVSKTGKVIGELGEAIKSGALIDSTGIERLTQSITGNVGTINRFESAEAVNATMSQYNWAPAWQAGTQVADATLKPGTMVNMVVNQDAYLALTTPGSDVSRVFGGWATFDKVPDLAYVRNNLAITSGMKSGDLYVVQVEVTQPVNAQIGIVGEQTGAADGGNQLHFNLPPNQRTSTFKFIGGSPLQ